MKLSALRTHPEHLKITSARAIDGDTIEATVHLPLEVMIKRRIRLKGYFAPEHHGSSPEWAEKARARLQAALDSHECHLAGQGMRMDKYGRLVATILFDGQALHGGAVLGELQLSLEDHRADLARARGPVNPGGPF